MLLPGSLSPSVDMFIKRSSITAACFSLGKTRIKPERIVLNNHSVAR